MIAIIDYGAGNTASVINVLNELKVKFVLTNDRKAIQDADKIILPGVGEASSAMNKLISLNLVDELRNTEKPFLGICLGMQLLFNKTEEGNVECLNVILGEAKKFNPANIKVPHMGWNEIFIQKSDELLKGISDKIFFYFAHSFYVPQNDFSTSICNYEINFSASVRFENFFGVQFHPEKSAQQGIQIIKNFLSL